MRIRTTKPIVISSDGTVIATLPEGHQVNVNRILLDLGAAMPIEPAIETKGRKGKRRITAILEDPNA